MKLWRKGFSPKLCLYHEMDRNEREFRAPLLYIINKKALGEPMKLC